MRRALVWIWPPLAVIAALWMGLGGPRWDPRVPLAFHGDALFYLAQAKSTMDHGWWWYNPSIGAPLGLHALTFAQNTNVNQAVVWVVSRFSDHVGLVANVAWILMVALSAVSATWGLRRIGVSAAAAGVAAVLFALTPFALYRQIYHFGIVTYLLPIPATIAMLLASGAAERRWQVREWIVPLAGCVLIGLNFIYFAFFGAFLILVAGLAGAVSHRSTATLRKGALCLGVIVMVTILNMVPNVLAWRAYGQAPGVAHLPPESEIYGLKIRHLIGPTDGTSFPPLQAWLAREHSANFPNENENFNARLGLVAAAGFLGLMACLVFPSSKAPDERTTRLRTAGILALAAVLLGTVGGLGSLFSLLVSPEVRTYNRVAPYIAFFSLAAVALWIDRWRDSRFVRRRTIVLSVVLAVGLADQLSALRSATFVDSTAAKDFSEVASFVTDLEGRLPDGAMVFQLPIRTYPLDAGQHALGPYEHLMPYLTSRHLRWSYPAMNIQQLRWERVVERLPEAEWPRHLAREGFSAILIARRAFPDGGSHLAELLQAGTGARVLATTDRYLALDIRAVRQLASAIR